MQNVKQKEHFLCFSAERGRGQKQAYEGKKNFSLNYRKKKKFPTILEKLFQLD